MTEAISLATTQRIPLWLKLVYTAFVAVLVPVYLHYYGWTNFLYFCDVALILTLIGIWIESPLLPSMGAIGITVAASWSGWSISSAPPSAIPLSA